MSTYKAVYNGSELFHINKKHDRLGRFDTGDGDGDGIADDHKNQRKEYIKRALKSSPASYAVSEIKKKDNKDYKEMQRSGARQFVAGALLYGVGRTMAEVSDSTFAIGLGYAAQVASVPISALGATRATVGTVGKVATSFKEK